MTLPAFSVNYFGRSVDIYVLEVPSPGYTGEAQLRFPDRPKVATGIQKLAQQYVITLFTAVGSDTIEPDRGTAVGDLLLGTVAPLEAEMTHIINIGNAEAVDQILENQTDLIDEEVETIPEDEQLDSAIVLDIRITDRTRVEFDIQINSVAGESRVFVVPLPIVVT